MINLKRISIKRPVIRALYGIFFLFSLTACHGQIQTKDSSGQTFNWEQRPERYIIINYWADWCSTCVGEIPELNKFYHAHHNKDALLLGVNFDGPSLDILQQMKRHWGIAYPQLEKDPKKMLSIPEIVAVPVTFIFDRQGQLLKSQVGGMTKQRLEKMLADIDKHRA